MKKYSIILSVWLILGIVSCSNFLNVTPKNVISMDDLESIKTSLAGFLFNEKSDGNGTNSIPTSPFEMPVMGLIEYTDEWDLSSLAENDLKDDEVRKIDWRTITTQHLWSNYYSPIGFMNLIIHQAETAEGEEDMRDYIMGEAYVTRAYCFFKLVQLFAPYKDNELGIPVCLATYEDFEKQTLKRSTQKEVYAQIISDLGEATERLERTNPRESFNILYSTKVVNRLLAEVYHFKALSAAAEADDWKNAASYADLETADKTPESDPQTLKDMFNVDKSSWDENDECGIRLWTSGRGYSTYDMYDIHIDPAFHTKYFFEDNDIRKNLFFNEIQYYDYSVGAYVKRLAIDKYSQYQQSWGWGYLFVGLRLSEMFLIQAEAYTMSNRLPEAKEILGRFKKARYTDGVFTIPDQKEDLLKDIYRERRKEFLIEGDLAWLDMKRLGVKMERVIAGVTYSLDGEGDYRYAFPIPLSEINYNKYIRQNPGWIINE